MLRRQRQNLRSSANNAIKDLIQTYQEANPKPKQTKIIAQKQPVKKIAESTSIFRRIINFIKSYYKQTLPFVITLIVIIFLYRIRQKRIKKQTKENFQNAKIEDEKYYDVCIIGGGPAGSTAGFYLSKGGLRVLQIEKNKYPSDRICGDIIPPTCHFILKDMGVFQELMQEGIGNWINSGGLVSPSGISFIADLSNSHDLLVQRILLDHKMVLSAQRQGVHLLHALVISLNPPDKNFNYWKIIAQSTVQLDDNSDPITTELTYFARMIVSAEGANCQFAREVGLIKGEPNTLWSRSFALPGTHNFHSDFIIFHPRELLPGFFIISREVEDYLSVCCFLMPNSNSATPSTMNREEFEKIYKDLIENNKSIRLALGPDVELTPFQSTPVRVGGSNKIYADQFVVVGSAAGHIDPLNGQGIQYAIIGGRLAARTILEGFARGDLSKKTLKRYQRRVNYAFGWDLWISGYLGRLLYYFPAIMEATASMIKKNGEEPLKLWLRARSGECTKFQLLRPDIIALIFVELVYQFTKNKIKSAF